MRAWVWAFAVLLAAPGIGHAIGICENTGTTYFPPRLFDEATARFAIPAKLRWCEEIHTRGTVSEDRGEITFVELRGLDGKVTELLSNARGVSARRLAKLGAVKAVSGKIDALLARRGFVPLVRKSGRCHVAAAWSRGGKSAKVDGFPADKLHVDVRAGRTRIHRFDVGLGAEERRGDAVVRGHFSARRRALAVWVLRPLCSGPPPGYPLGSECYKIDEIEVRRLDATSTPALESCFAK